MVDWDNAGRKVEILANAAIILLVCLIAVALGRNYFKGFSGASPVVTIGSKAPLDTAERSHGRATLVLVLSTTCHFCSESGTFYRALVIECKKRGVHTVALFPQTVDEGRAYLSSMGVSVDAIQQASLRSIHVDGTPTLLLVGKRGFVDDLWTGKLPSEREGDLLSKLDSIKE